MSDLSDEQLFAELRPGERAWFTLSGSRNAPHGNCYAREREWLCRLAEARIELRDAEQQRDRAVAERDALRAFVRWVHENFSCDEAAHNGDGVVCRACRAAGLMAVGGGDDDQ